MATKHWVRDVLLTDPNNYIAGGNHTRANALLFHFLRVAGWEWLWECDGDTGPHSFDPNHVLDGSMRATGVTNWLAVNAGVPTKDTTIVHSGEQSLKIVAGALGDGAVSDPLLDMNAPVNNLVTDTGDSLVGPVNGLMTLTDDNNPFNEEDLVGASITITGSGNPTNNGTFPIVHRAPAGNQQISFFNPSGVAESYITANPPTTPGYTISYVNSYRYELVVWAYNAGDPWDVQVDPGTGTPVTLGQIPNNGGSWTRYHFAFHVTGSGNVTVRFVSTGTGAFTIYIGGVHVFRSQFEYLCSDHFIYTAGAPNVRGTDGVLTNPDQFSTAGSYTPGVQNVGSHLFVWDATNNKNSGVYEIVADLGGGVVQVNMRSGSAAFTNASGLTWRIVNLCYPTAGGPIPNSPMPDYQQSAGFGVESPHSSKWRFFLRQNQSGGPTVKSSEMWSAPEDTDFDFSTGHFYKSGPSIMRNRAEMWTRNVSGGGINPNIHTWRGCYTYITSPTYTRTFVMTDEDGAFFLFVHYDTHSSQHGCHLTGYLGSSPQHPGIMSFYQMARWENIGQANEITFDESDGRYFSAYGTGFDQFGQSRRAALGQLGYGTTTDDAHTMAQQKANPFSGREWVHTLFMGLDPDGGDNVGGEMDSDCGVYQGRTSIAADLSTFDSDQFLHFDNGLVIEWSGETIL